MLAVYRPRWLGKDVAAGLVLSALLVPQGMAYAELAGLPAITGLYTTVLCLRRIRDLRPVQGAGARPRLVPGPDDRRDDPPARRGRRGPGAGGRVRVHAGPDGRCDHRAAGAFRLGFIADLLSRPTQIGYMNGLALTIVIGQLPKLFGFSVDGDGLIAEATGFVAGVGDGRDGAGGAARRAPARLLVILLLSRLLPRIPAVLVAVVLAIVAVVRLRPRRARGRRGRPVARGLSAVHRAHRAVGRPGPARRGRTRASHWSRSTDTISTASAFAARRGEDVDGDREMIGIGAANVAAGLFQGFPVSTSGSRTAVAEQNGAKTQVTGLVGAARGHRRCWCSSPACCANLPQPTLAAIVIAASLSLADLRGMRRLWRQRRSDFWLAVAAFLGVALLGVLPGIAIAVALSVLDVFNRAWRPYRAVLGRVPGLAGLPRHPWPPGRRATARAGAVSLRRAAVLRQRAHVPRRHPAPRRDANPRRSGSSSPPSRSRTSTRPPPTCSPISTSGSTPAESAWSSPRSRIRLRARSTATS